MTYLSVAAVLIEPGHLKIEERLIPALRPGEVLVEIASVGVCGSDVHYYKFGRIGKYVIDSPLILGHEASGVIRAVGAGVSEGRVGERVSIEPGVPCRACSECLAGLYNLCKDVRFLATPPVDGAFTRYLVHDAAFVHSLPDAVSDDAGALIEPLSVGIWANRKAGTRVGDRVLVTGAGAIGIVCSAVARTCGAERIVVVDPLVDRREVAAQFGATAVLDPSELEELSGFNVLLECSGNVGAVESGIEALGPAGRAILVGMGPEPSHSIPVQVVQNREIWVTGTFRYANTYPTAIELARTGTINLDALVSNHFALADAEQALIACDAPGSIKSIVRVAQSGPEPHVQDRTRAQSHEWGSMSDSGCLVRRQVHYLSLNPPSDPGETPS